MTDGPPVPEPPDPPDPPPPPLATPFSLTAPPLVSSLSLLTAPPLAAPPLCLSPLCHSPFRHSPHRRSPSLLTALFPFFTSPSTLLVSPLQVFSKSMSETWVCSCVLREMLSKSLDPGFSLSVLVSESDLFVTFSMPSGGVIFAFVRLFPAVCSSYSCVLKLDSLLWWQIKRCLVQLSQIRDLSSSCSMDSSVTLVPSFEPFGGSPFTAVCRLCSGLGPDSVSTSCFAGKMFFLGVASLTLSSLHDMGGWFSNVYEVPLLDGHAHHHYITFARLAERFVWKTSFEANDGAEIARLTTGSFSLNCLWFGCFLG